MTDEPSEPDALAALLELARVGDASALQTLFLRYREPLLQRIRLMMGPEARRFAESHDFLQETFTAALPALTQFELRGNGSFLNWLTAIARNRIRHELRCKREEALSALSSALGLVSAGAESPDNTLSVEAALSLLDALSQLSDDERQLVELRDMEGRTFGEIAAALGCGERQAQRLHARALIRLSRYFREAGAS